MAVCDTPAGKARQGPVVVAAWQLYVSVFLHPSTRALPQAPAHLCCNPLGLSSWQCIAPMRCYTVVQTVLVGHQHVCCLASCQSSASCADLLSPNFSR